MGLALGEETTYSKLNKLLAKGELKPFVEAHSEFACQRGCGVALCKPPGPASGAWRTRSGRSAKLC